MSSTAESPHRAAAGREEGEGPIAPPTRGHKGVRKAKNATTEFSAVSGVGGTCLHCRMLVKTKQQSGTILAQNLFGFRLAPSIQQVAWDACSTLQKCKARPLDSSDAATRPAPGVSGIRGGASGAGSVVFSPQLLGSQPPGGRSRKKMAGPGLTAMYKETRKEVLDLLASWVVRRKAVCVLDAWEKVKQHHIVNLLAEVGDKVVFLDSVYCGDECQDAPG